MSAPVTAGDIQRLLDQASMSRLQIRAIAILVTLSMLDGYDVVSISYAAPVVAQSLSIGKTALGIVFSSGLIGMAFGSLLLAPLADARGRRAAIIGALILMILGGIGCALAASVTALAAARVVSGLGIGTLIAVTTPLAAEFANLRRRAFCVALTTMAFPAGAMVGGLVAAVLIRDMGWQSVFAVKSVVGTILLLVVFIWLPESPSFLMSSNKARASERLQLFLQRCGLPAQPVLAAETSGRDKKGYADLFAPDHVGVTLTLVAANALFAMVGYFWSSWLPNMLVDAGHDASTASIVAAINQFAGVIGGLLLGFAARWIKLNKLTIAAFVGAGLAMAMFGLMPAYLPFLALAAASCGFCIHASISGLYAIVATSFGPHVRASGTGLVIGIGRISSSIAPLFAGWMFASGFGRDSVSAIFALLAIAAALALVAPLRTHRRRQLHGAV